MLCCLCGFAKEKFFFFKVITNSMNSSSESVLPGFLLLCLYYNFCNFCCFVPTYSCSHKFTLKVVLHNASSLLRSSDKVSARSPCRFCISFDAMNSVVCKSSTCKWLFCVFTDCSALVQKVHKRC